MKYVVGQVLKPQGIKGEVKVLSVSPNPERFKTLKQVFFEKDIIQTYSIETVRISDKFVFLKLKGIDNRDDCEKLRGCDVLIDAKDLIDLKPGEHFVHDLIGCQVVTDAGVLLGKLVEISQFTSNDVYVVKNEAGNEILLPATKEVIKQVEVENKRIIVHLLEGLID